MYMCAYMFVCNCECMNVVEGRREKAAQKSKGVREEGEGMEG
jgi:hypothetical protein